MVGGSSAGDIFNNAKPAKASTEKKKRKRPSKKVPTTVLEASSNNFMNLVQKLTGSAAELAVAKNTDRRPKAAIPSPHLPQYSSPSTHTNQHDNPQHGTHLGTHQQLRSSNMGFNEEVVDDSSSHNIKPTPYSSANFTDVLTPIDLRHYSGASSTGGGFVTPEFRDDAHGHQHLYQYIRCSDTSEAYPSSSKEMESEMETESSPISWRDSMNPNSSADFWYQVDPMPAMRA